MRFIVFIFLLFLFQPGTARSAETQPGDACATNGAIQQTGGAQQIPGRILVCNGSSWQTVTEQTTDGKMLFQVNNDTGSCTAAKLGRIRYNGTSTWQYCNGSAWATLGGSASSSGWIYGRGAAR